MKQWDEVRAVQDVVCSFVDDSNRDVVLVLHSYGGWPGSRAVKCLDKKTGKKRGKATGIVETDFITTVLLPDHAPMAALSYLPPWLTIEIYSGADPSLSPLLETRITVAAF